ncbi:hypothetical protein JL721_11003 [Aureococcus anophagefferens]|nr:hypothetical protein JL721_11003 [Aureococcus anophagefferens]
MDSALRDSTGGAEEALLLNSDAPERQRVASFLSCVFNLTNTIVGSGMLGLPAAFSNAGSLLGCAFSCCSRRRRPSGSTSSRRRIIVSAKAGGDAPSSFRSVATAAAPRFAVLIDGAVAVKCFGVAASYLIVVGDTMPVVMAKLGGFAANRSPWIVGAALLVAPLCYMPRLDGLKFASALSLGFVMFLTVMIVEYYLEGGGGGDVGTTSLAVFDLDTAKTMTIFIFGYTCHQNIFAVVNEIKRPTPARLDAVVATSIGTACGIYLLVAVCGYMTFGDKVQGDILDNYPVEPAITVARVFVAALVALSFPLQCHPSRACVMSLLQGARPPPPDDASDAALALRKRAEDRRTRAEHVAVTTVFLVGATLIALSVESLSTILSVVGATGRRPCPTSCRAASTTASPSRPRSGPSRSASSSSAAASSPRP